MPITITPGTFAVGTRPLDIAAGTLSSLFAKKEEREEKDRLKALDDLSLLIKLHGPDAPNLPQFGILYKKIFKKDYPTIEVDIPAEIKKVTTKEVTGKRVLPLTAPPGGFVGGLYQAPGTAEAPFGTKEFPVFGEVTREEEVTPARKEVRPAPLGGAAAGAFQQPIRQLFGDDKLAALGIPKQMWNIPTDQFLQRFPEFAKDIFDLTAQARGDQEQAKFIRQMLLGDISGLSPTQLKYAIEWFNATTARHPEWGMQPIPPEIAGRMVTESVNYQYKLGRISLMEKQGLEAETRAESLRALTPERINLIRAQVARIVGLLPAEKANLEARTQKALAEVQSLIVNKGMTPYQAARLAMDKNFKTIDDQRMLLSLYVTALSQANKLDPISGKLVPVPGMAEIANAIGALASQSALMLRTYSTNQGVSVSYEEILQNVAEWKSKGMSDTQIAYNLTALGIPVADFLHLLPSLKPKGKSGVGR